MEKYYYRVVSGGRYIAYQNGKEYKSKRTTHIYSVEIDNGRCVESCLSFPTIPERTSNISQWANAYLRYMPSGETEFDFITEEDCLLELI